MHKMSTSLLTWLTGLLTVVFLLPGGSYGLFDFQTPRCDLPSIDHSSQLIDVLGDSEKVAVCRQPRPDDLCPNVGPADNACKSIARAVGGVRNVSCSHPNTCAFLVKAPIQSPNTPGYAYVSLCTPEFIGVIFPCRENNLVISNPFWKGVYHSDEASAITTNFGNVGSNPLCAFPRLDSIDPGIDVLGDREKANICSLPRPSHLCSKGRGAADEACKRIASVAGDTSNPRCLRKRTCGFHVKRPVQHPNEPGDAYVSLCKTEYDGVIFPCRENNLHIVDPFYNEDIFGTVDEPSEPPPNWELPGVTTCGEVHESISKFEFSSRKIVGAESTKRGQFPWQVALKRRSTGGRIFNIFCGGSIITQRHILTAAHCFEITDYSYHVTVGEFDRTETEPDEQEIPFTTKDLISHPKYNRTTDENDIAIIRLTVTIQLNAYAQPICLPARSLQYKDKLNCVISGWGKTWDNDFADIAITLMAARVLTLRYEDCRKPQSYGSKIKDTMFCAGSFKGGPDSCQGDSGGPIVCDVQDSNNQHFLIQYGITSFGDGCGKVKKPGVYTRLSEFQEWIEKSLKR